MKRWGGGGGGEEGEGGYSTNVYTGRLRPDWSNPLPFHILLFTKKVPLSYTFY